MVYCAKITLLKTPTIKIIGVNLKLTAYEKKSLTYEKLFYKYRVSN